MRGSSIRGCIGFLVLLWAGAAFGGPAGWGDWRHGSSGHALALSAAERADAPLVVYFHVDWCGWCQKLNGSYLRNGAVREVLTRVQKVEINPERGRPERGLFEEYGASGYPAFYVFVPGSGERPVRLTPFQGGREEPLAEFAERIRGAATRQYNNWARRLYQQGDEAGAGEVLQRALAFDPRNAEAHFAQGLMHHKAGNEGGDRARLRQAELSFERALALDPGHVESRRHLEVLRAR